VPPTGPTWSAGSGRGEANFAGGLFGGGGAHGDGETGDEEEADGDFVVDGGGWRRTPEKVTLRANGLTGAGET